MESLRRFPSITITGSEYPGFVALMAFWSGVGDAKWPNKRKGNQLWLICYNSRDCSRAYLTGHAVRLYGLQALCNLCACGLGMPYVYEYCN